MAVRVILNPQMKAQVVTVLKSGLYGRTQGDAIERLAAQRLAQLRGSSVLPMKKKGADGERQQP